MDILQNNKPGKYLQGWLSMDRWNYLLLIFYVFTMPFISAFAYSGTISIPLVLAVILFLLMGIKVMNSARFPHGFIGLDIVIIILILFLVTFTFIINGLGNSKSFNHTVGYLSTFLLFHITIKFTLFAIANKKLVFRRVLQWLAYITIFSAFFSIIEFFLSNVLGININNYIPRPSANEAFYDATVLGLFYRARGFAPESGHFSFMMELFSPLLIYYMYFSGFCKWNKIIKGLFVVFVILSFIFAVSTASFAIIPVAFAIASLVYVTSILHYIKKYLFKFLPGTALVTLIIFMLISFLSFYSLIFLSLIDKLL